jgi:Family of unknown function (DUF6152)
MRRTRFMVCGAAGLPLFASLAWAHHSLAAEFDVKQPVHVTGVVTKLELVNPHAWIYVDAKDANGQVIHWAFEAGASPNILIRRGFTKASLPPGTEVIVDGYRAKDDSFRASGSSLTFSDGRKVFIGSTNPGEGPGDGKQ